ARATRVVVTGPGHREAGRAGEGRQVSDCAGGGRRVHPDRGLGAIRRLRVVADGVGGDAVETVAVPVLPGEGRRGSCRAGLERLERAAVVGDVDVISGQARAARVVVARPGHREAGRGAVGGQGGDATAGGRCVHRGRGLGRGGFL